LVEVVSPPYRHPLPPPPTPPRLQVTIIKQGYLSKRSRKSRSDFKRRFFVLDTNGMLYYYSHKVGGGLGGGGLVLALGWRVEMWT
jgi:hypothetical protein